MKDPLTSWLEIMQYNYKNKMTICELGRNYVAGPISMASENHI